MLKLEDIKKDAQVRGLSGDAIAKIVSAEWVGDDCINVFYVDANGSPGTQQLFRSDQSIQRAVKENCNVLKFNSAEFESS